MINSLKLGKVKGVEAIVELLESKNLLLLERIETNPKFYIEELAFGPDGSLRGLMREKDHPTSKDKLRTKFELEIINSLSMILYKEGVHMDNSKMKESIAKNLVTDAYDIAQEFHKALENVKVTPDNREKLEKINPIMEKIISYGVMGYLFFTVK